MPKIKPKPEFSVTDFDRIPHEERFFSGVRESAEGLASFYGFEPIHLSLLEGVKSFGPLMRAGFFDERYPISCKSATGTDMLLNPSLSLSALRAYMGHKMNDLPHPLKFSFSGESFFSHNRAKGDIHSLAEWGLVMIGEEGPIAEAEIIQIIWKQLAGSGLESPPLEFRINAVGCSDCRPSFRSHFVAHFRSRAHRLCKNCKRHLKKNSTKILACEEEQCRMLAAGAPQLLDFLCEMCKKHLRGILEFLDEAKIPYVLDTKFFRDGSWYNLVIFECSYMAEFHHGEGEHVEAKKKKFVLMEGGRISKAGELIVGRKLDAAAAVLLPRSLQTVLSTKNIQTYGAIKPKVFLAQLGDLAKRKSLNLIEMLRTGGISLQESLGRDSVKSQLKVAEKVGAEIALILGQKEALDNTVIVREIGSGIQETIPQEKLIDFLNRKLTK